MSDLSVAIIIPVKYFNLNLEKAIQECLKLDYANFELLVFPDEINAGFIPFEGKIRIIPTGNMGPALKRDLALEHSKADIFAFLDDDAYPEPNWLNKAVKHFKQQEIAAVGGPSVTPLESSFAGMASGYAFASVTVSGPYTYRYVPGSKIMEVDDYPSCNFLVRREIFAKLGGFDSSFYPGEDTKLCLEITKKLNKKIIYDPDVLVYHHRRDSLNRHIKQIENYATHRGNFAKRFPETSRKIAYFVPSLFVGLLIIGAGLALISLVMKSVYLACITFYSAIIAANAVWVLGTDKQISFFKKLALVIPVIIFIIVTHITYGIFFIKGLFLKQLKEEKSD
ncbi:MAG: glycosyltransferase [Candidatus Omnitrophica bacterium]|nr:glycosyltransferase [Candidatus Omnitrophota bacterium]